MRIQIYKKKVGSGGGWANRLKNEERKEKQVMLKGIEMQWG